MPGDSVVHQQRDAAEGVLHPVSQRRHGTRVGDVNGHGHDASGLGGGADLLMGGVQGGFVQVGQADMHAQRRKAFGGGKADAAGGTRDDGAPFGRQDF